MRLFATLSLLSAVFISPALAKADVIFSSNFGVGGPDQLNITSVGGFTATSGNIDLLSTTGSYTDLCPTTGNCVDLAGNSPSVTSSTAVGSGTYDIQFVLTGAGASRAGYTPTTTTEVFFGSDLLGTYLLGPTDVVNFNSVVTGSGALTFEVTQTDNGAVGSVLDSASISSVTPEPSSLVLLGSGLMTGAGMLFKRRKQ